MIIDARYVPLPVPSMVWTPVVAEKLLSRGAERSGLDREDKDPLRNTVLDILKPCMYEIVVIPTLGS